MAEPKRAINPCPHGARSIPDPRPTPVGRQWSDAGWARLREGELLPLTHCLRIVRGIMPKGASLNDLRVEARELIGRMLLAIAITHRTLD